MKPEVEQELAHLLLVELLAHQFTFPVKWIETQDVLLMEQGIERLVEIGPAPILTNMAKRTMENLYDGHDPLIKNREFLSAERHTNQVYYRVDPPIEEPRITKSATTIAAPISAPMAIPEPTMIARQAAPIVADIPLPVDYVLRTIIAGKLKKTAAEIDTSLSIKKLAGGRSTMENEIVGDLIAEFKSLPDRPEDHSLQSLADLLHVPFTGQLGHQTSAQIARLFTTRMPGGFSMDTAKQYMESTWGILTGRSSMVLLLATTLLPASRLKTFEAAEVYLDGLVAKHAIETGIRIQKTSEIAPAVQGMSTKIASSSDSDQTRKAQSEKKLQMYANDIGFDLKAGEKKASKTQVALDEALGELDLWNAEHGATYAAGIRPLVQTSKARSYESWMHWASQDITTLFHQIMGGQLEYAPQDMAERLLHISNCANPKSIRLLESFSEAAKQVPTQDGDAKSTIFESLATMCTRNIEEPPVFRSTYENLMPVTEFDLQGQSTVKEVPRISLPDVRRTILTLDKGFNLPALSQAINLEYPNISIKSQGDAGWQDNAGMSLAYFQTIAQLRNSGTTFQQKKVLITGAGKGSIGAEVLKGLLAGGAHVLCTTSKYSTETVDVFQQLYAAHGGKNSRLVIMPFNQASQQDVESLVSYIYSSGGLGWDLDIVLPFAAIPEADRDIDQIDAKSELAHRAMLTNTIRLLGIIKRQKEIRDIDTRPAQIILPLSSNHGIIGRDGLYAESKLALEGLLHKWHSEEWSSYLSLCGAEIGWTRGTGLMNSNDIVAQEIERVGVRTFSRDEMAANILALCAPSIVQFCQEEPIMVDLNGGLDKVKNLGAQLKRIRAQIQDTQFCLRTVFDEKKHDTLLVHGSAEKPEVKAVNAVSLADLSTLPEIDYKRQVAPLHAQLKEMVDLDHVAVITGFAETGSFGSARTRMEVEFKHGFSDAGCIELAWIMGMIKRPASNEDVRNWIDSETGEVVHESVVKQKYEERILQNTGIRFAKSEDSHQQHLQEIVIEADLAPITTTAQTAIEYARIHGQNAEIWQEGNADEWRVVLKAGATMMVPKATSQAPTAAGLLPTGWSPKSYGIDETIISQVDSITLYGLVAAVEALLASGIPDFYTLYKDIHTSEVANCIGSGQGGLSSLRSLFRDRYTDQTVQNDILQETFANTTGAWVNMLLLGASGPIRTPVGACATALESLDSAVELINSGKVKLALVGGVDDWLPEVGNEFGNMRATVNTKAQEKIGRSAKEFSRPMSTSRAGFVEAQGAGIQVVTSARLALDLGLPIHGIVAFTGLASDKPSRSVPAPGKGLLNFAAAAESSETPSPLLDISCRRRILERKLARIEANRLAEIEDLAIEADLEPSTSSTAHLAARRADITREATVASASARQQAGTALHRQDTRISPLEGALATWNLNVDAISVLCLHGTSTQKGDTNEAFVLDRQLAHMGRSKTTAPALAVCSKWLTGHGKGAAGAWSLNTALQIIATGTVPRNGNLDDLAPELRELEHVDFLGGKGAALRMASGAVDAVSVTAFGFGQKGAQAVVLHPRFLFATLAGGEAEFDAYWKRMSARRRVARRELSDGIWKGDLVGKRIKHDAAWAEGEELDVLLNRGWRMH